jgi:hypothetical protein
MILGSKDFRFLALIFYVIKLRKGWQVQTQKQKYWCHGTRPLVLAVIQPEIPPLESDFQSNSNRAISTAMRSARGDAAGASSAYGTLSYNTDRFSKSKH